MVELSRQRFRPPSAKFSKTYSLATLERWHYAYNSGGLEALQETRRSLARRRVSWRRRHHERESEMLTLLVQAVRKHGPADALYLDNGATYRGQALSLACARMGTTVIHAKPYDERMMRDAA